MTSLHTRRALWAFAAECGIILALLLLADSLARGVLIAGATLALLIPIVAFTLMLFDPAVYRVWREVLRELRALVVAAPRGVASCLSFKHIACLGRAMKHMKRYPDTADDWLALVLFPFKAYVLMAVPFVWISCGLHSLFVADRVRFGSDALTPIFYGFVGSIIMLSFGALVQGAYSQPGRSTQTVRIAVLGMILLWAGANGLLPLP